MDIQSALKVMKKILDKNPMNLLIHVVLLTILIVGFAIFLSLATLYIVDYLNNISIFTNSVLFLYQSSSNLPSIFTTSLLTSILIIISARSLSSAKDALKQSEKQQKQFQDEQRIKDIEKRLELFYIPVQNILYAVDKSIEFRKKNESDLKEIFSTENFEAINMLKELGKFKFLAEESTCKSFMKYVFDKGTFSTIVQWTFYETDAEKYRQDLTSRINSDVKNYLFELNYLKRSKL